MNKYYPVKKKFYAIITDMFILVSGTARSGKSEYAEQKLSGMEGIKIYIATAKIYDDEMLSRVILHQKRRQNLGFMTIEKTHDLGELYIPEKVSVLVEGLTTWTANEMFRLEGVCVNAGEKVFADFRKLRERSENIIVVADDIFSDGITYDDTTETYRKILAELIIKLASDADEVIEIFAGIPIAYKTGRNKL